MLIPFFDLDLLSAQVDAHLDTLWKDQTAQFLRACGLADKVRLWREQRQAGRAGPNFPLSAVAGMDAAALTATFATFSSSLLSLGTLVSPQCERYCSPYCHILVATFGFCLSVYLMF